METTVGRGLAPAVSPIIKKINLKRIFSAGASPRPTVSFSVFKQPDEYPFIGAFVSKEKTNNDTQNISVSTPTNVSSLDFGYAEVPGSIGCTP